MLFNYVKIALRNLIRNKLFSFINIAGLSMGMAAFMLIFTYCWNALHYDDFHKDSGRIYRIIQKRNNVTTFDTNVSWGFAKQLKEGGETTWDVVRTDAWTYWMTAGQNSFKQKIYFADANFFNVFNIPLAKGSPDKVLGLPNSIVISKQLAEKLFGNSDPMGKTVRVNATLDFIVTGLIDELPRNTIFETHAIIPLANINTLYYEDAESGWHDISANVFIHSTDEEAAIAPKLAVIFRSHVPKTIKNEEPSFLVQPLTDVYLNKRDYDFGTLVYSAFKFGSFPYILILTGIAALILGLAIVNYFNLTTSIYTRRIKEIGVRKVTGASKIQLRLQFIGEAMVTTFISLLMSVVVFQLAKPLFESFTGETLPISSLGNLYVVSGAFIQFGLIIGLINGTYPAFYLTSRKAAGGNQIFKPSVTEDEYFRNSLVVFQVAISIALTISLTIITLQLKFMKESDKGFRQAGMITIPIDMANTKNLSPLAPVFARELKKHGEIQNVTLHQASMGRFIKNFWSFYADGKNEEMSFKTTYIDESFINTYEIKLLAGTGFEEYSDSLRTSKVILNESSAKHLGWTPDEAVHKIIRMHWKGGPQMEVIGVVKDFHVQSLHHAIEPVVFQYAKEYYQVEYISVSINSSDPQQTIAKIQNEWKVLMAGFPFEYYFTEDDFALNYKAEERQEQSILAASFLAIFIACLGLFGLASYSALQRTKEIGIRKVLGASVSGILLLLSRRHVMLILIAFAAAVPTAYFFMTAWIQGFAFRMSIQWWMFMLPGVFVAMIALISVWAQSWRAAVSNPVNSLRSE